MSNVFLTLEESSWLVSLLLFSTCAFNARCTLFFLFNITSVKTCQGSGLAALSSVYVNHRPAFGLSREKLEWAFDVLGYQAPEGGVSFVERGDLLDLLQTRGESSVCLASRRLEALSLKKQDGFPGSPSLDETDLG